MRLSKWMGLGSIVGLLVIMEGSAAAAILVQYQGTSYIGATGNQPLAKVVVGTANVSLGRFGVFGLAQVNENIKFVIFDSLTPSAPVYLSAAQAVPGLGTTFPSETDFLAHAQWYDSPETAFTLLANHTYGMGLLSAEITTPFHWGSSPDNPFGPYPTVIGDGLSLPFMQALDNSGVIVNGDFTNTPTLYTVDNSNRRTTSFRAFTPAPVPEPSSLSVLALGGMGLLVRRRKTA